MADGRTDDYGRIFELKCVNKAGVAIDIPSLAGIISDLEIVFLKPSKATLVKSATYSEDGSDGLVRCIILITELDEAGRWQANVRFLGTTPSIRFASSAYAFAIEDPLKPWG